MFTSNASATGLQHWRVRASVRWIATALIASGCSFANAFGGKHEHGMVKLDVAVEGAKLTLHLDAPLDSLLGFEHSPRTDGQRKAADALLQQMKNPQAVAAPDPQAQCALTGSSVNSDTLIPGQKSEGRKSDHADLGATFEFTCAQPQALRSLTVNLFENFKRIRRVEARVAGAKGQGATTLTARKKTLQLVR
jgi:hypothetical protein